MEEMSRDVLEESVAFSITFLVIMALFKYAVSSGVINIESLGVTYFQILALSLGLGILNLLKYPVLKHQQETS